MMPSDWHKPVLQNHEFQLTVHLSVLPFQEFGQNPLVSVIMGCLQFLKDGEGNAKEERQIHHQISHVTGTCFKINPCLLLIF